MTTRSQLIETLCQTEIVWHKVKPVFVVAATNLMLMTIRDSNFSIEWESDEYCSDWYEETATRVLQSIKTCFDKTCDLKLVGRPIVKAVRTNQRRYNEVGEFIGEKEAWTYSIEVFVKGFEKESYV